MIAFQYLLMTLKVTFLKLEIILAPKIYSVRLVISLHSYTKSWTVVHNNQKETEIIVNHAIFLEITSRKFLVRNLAMQAMEKLTTELHSLSEMDRRHVVSILAEIANGYDDFNDMLIYLEFYPNHKILIS